ncbi:MAG TPA: cytochrome c peroxidase [Flavobacteriales bacterium]
MRPAILLLFSLALAGCRRDEAEQQPAPAAPPGITPFVLQLPPGALELIGPPVDMSHNPLTVQGVALGRKLFHDPVLSADHSVSCASCHRQEHAFADPAVLSQGVGGALGTRHAMSLANLAWSDRFFWDGRIEGLEAQAHDPVVHPLEMANTWPTVEARLAVDPAYRALFRAAFGSESTDSSAVTNALAQFVRSLTSFDSPFDRFHFGGDVSAMSEEAQNGLVLFNSQGRCGGCHTLGLFTDQAFRNNGLDLVHNDPGLGAHTGNPGDLGKFKVPTLRNVAVSAPYMHDGRFATLEEVLQHYNGGVHMASPNVDLLMDYWGMNPTPFSPNEINDLLAFLNALTDEQFLTDPAHAAP